MWVNIPCMDGIATYTLDDFCRRLSTGLPSASSSPFSSGSKQAKGLGTGKILQKTVGCHPFTSLCCVFLCRFFQRSEKLVFVPTPGAFKDLLCSTIVFQNMSNLETWFGDDSFFTCSKGLKISVSRIGVSTLVLLAVQLEPNLESPKSRGTIRN